jgi:hypothetical protein
VQPVRAVLICRGVATFDLRYKVKAQTPSKVKFHGMPCRAL